MTHTFKLARRAARFRVPLLATLLTFGFAACDNADPTDPVTSADPVAAPEAAPEAAPVALATASLFRGGIPFGTSAQPTTAFGDHFNGALRNIYPQYLLKELAGIKARGGKVALMFAGNERMYKDASGHFSLAKWKARIDRFRKVNFLPFILDGTIIGHYMIDEPNDAHNWNGRPVSPATLEEMGRYSKQLWPRMVTIVRTRPSYLGGNHRYVDAAWAQYAVRFGSASKFVSDNVSQAKSRGLGLVVGINVLKGGTNKRPMTATQVRSIGAALLSSTYPCAFISWHYDVRYLSSSSIRDAMKYLRSKAQNRSAKTCHG